MFIIFDFSNNLIREIYNSLSDEEFKKYFLINKNDFQTSQIKIYEQSFTTVQNLNPYYTSVIKCNFKVIFLFYYILDKLF